MSYRDWKVGDWVCLMRDGVEVERREVVYRAFILGTSRVAYVLNGINEMHRQESLMKLGWRLVQDDGDWPEEQEATR